MAKRLSQLDYTQVIRKAFNDDTGTLDISTGNSLVTEEFDDIQLTYTGSDLTGVDYYNDGAIVAQLELSYTSGNLTRVRRV